MGQPQGSAFIDLVLLPAAGMIAGGLFQGWLGAVVLGVLGFGVGMRHGGSVEETSDEKRVDELGGRVEALERRVEELEGVEPEEPDTE